MCVWVCFIVSVSEQRAWAKETTVKATVCGQPDDCCADFLFFRIQLSASARIVQFIFILSFLFVFPTPLSILTSPFAIQFENKKNL